MRLLEFSTADAAGLPGDLIATGSPEGTGGSFDPSRFLKAGQTGEIELEGIGVLRNHVVAEPN